MRTPGTILGDSAKTWEERNGIYKNNDLLVGLVQHVLWPTGPKLQTAEAHHRWHLYELIIVKLTRFVVSGLTHVDSIHDIIVYASMIENAINGKTVPIEEIETGKRGQGVYE